MSDRELIIELADALESTTSLVANLSAACDCKGIRSIAQRRYDNALKVLEKAIAAINRNSETTK